nr:hypothetical protein [Halothiobacillus sp.]
MKRTRTDALLLQVRDVLADLLARDAGWRQIVKAAFFGKGLQPRKAGMAFLPGSGGLLALVEGGLHPGGKD